MKLEQQVCSLELAKKLKELGVKQESVFYWCSFDPRGKNDWRGPYVTDGAPAPDGERWLRYPEGGQHTFRKNFDCGDTASAFTVAELGEMLGCELTDANESDSFSLKCGNAIDFWWASFGNQDLDITPQHENVKFADALAELAIFLLEEKVVECLIET